MTTSIGGLLQMVSSKALIYLLQWPRRGTGPSREGGDRMSGRKYSYQSRNSIEHSKMHGTTS